MEIQKRENDLVLATFGRGFYVLDDYSPLRNFKKDDLQKTALISPVKTAWMYVESTPLGVRSKGFQGESYYAAPNPKPGSVFTYYLKEDIKSLRQKRQEAEKEKIRKGEAPYYPGIDTLRLEDIQAGSYLLFTITDEAGVVIRRLKAPAKKGINRITWDFRTDAKGPITFTPFDESMVFNSRDQGIFVLPGNYKVSLSKFEDSVYTELVPAKPFTVQALNMNTLSGTDKKAIYNFGKKVLELHRAALATNAYKNELVNKLKYMKEAAIQTPSVDQSVAKKIIDLEKRLVEVNRKINGDTTLEKREFEAPTSIQSRISSITSGLISSTSAPTNTFINSYNVAATEFATLLAETKSVAEDVKKIEALLEQNGAPYTPGRIPDWKQ